MKGKQTHAVNLMHKLSTVAPQVVWAPQVHLLVREV